MKVIEDMAATSKKSKLFDVPYAKHVERHGNVGSVDPENYQVVRSRWKSLARRTEVHVYAMCGSGFIASVYGGVIRDADAWKFSVENTGAFDLRFKTEDEAKSGLLLALVDRLGPKVRNNVLEARLLKPRARCRDTRSNVQDLLRRLKIAEMEHDLALLELAQEETAQGIMQPTTA